MKTLFEVKEPNGNIISEYIACNTLKEINSVKETFNMTTNQEVIKIENETYLWLHEDYYMIKG